MKLIRTLFYSLCLSFLMLHAQPVAAQTTAYIKHTIASGETLSGLAKQYHTTVGDIMRLNGMDTKSVLTIGEVVKIPSAKTATTTKPVTPIATAKPAPAKITVKPIVTASTSGGIPITHIVQKGESLYTLSKKYHTTIPQLKTWNKMSSDVIIDGHSIIVGYAAAKDSSVQKAIVQLPAVQPVTVAPKQDTITEKPEQSMASTDTATVQLAEDTSITEVTKPVEPQAPSIINIPVAQQPIVDMSSIGEGGYFTSSFGIGVEGRSLENSSGVSMTFKTASGWSDKKYYILMNNVPPGSIVKIAANNKTVYAKVLWSMASMPQNEGLDFRISTAAASALGLIDAKFPLTVTYYE